MKDWIENWLSDRQVDELKYFHRFRHVRDAETKEDVYQVVREIKQLYDASLEVFDQEGREAFDRLWRKASAGDFYDGFSDYMNTPDVRHVAVRSKKSPRLLTVCNAVAHYELGAGPLDYGGWLGGPVELFKLVDGRGSHFKKKRKASPPEVKRAAESVIERDGWDAYPVRRRTKKGPGFPNTLLKATAKQLEDDLEIDSISPSTVRRHLGKTDFTMPSHSRLKRRST